MLDRTRSLLSAAVGLSLTLTLLVAPPVHAASQKVVIIVGPTGDLTKYYKETGNYIAQTAENAGAIVVKVYSPKATWRRVRNAVAGANVIVYLGHGNGYPNPYGNTELTDRANGWGLNKTTTGGSRESNLVYCGEKALLGTLTQDDGSTQWAKCGGKTDLPGVHPADNFVMIYSNACYAPGAGEGWDVKATATQARERVGNYSYPVLQLGAGAYFATDLYQGASTLVELVLSNPNMAFGAIAEQAPGYDADAQRRFDHADLTGKRIWIQRTNADWLGTDYWYAYAGRPSLTPSGSEVTYFEPGPPRIATFQPAPGSTTMSSTPTIRATFSEPVGGVSASTFVLKAPDGSLVPAQVTYNADLMRARLVPDQPLVWETTYTAVARSGITDLDGEHLSRTGWRLTVKPEA